MRKCRGSIFLVRWFPKWKKNRAILQSWTLKEGWLCNRTCRLAFKMLNIVYLSLREKSIYKLLILKRKKAIRKTVRWTNMSTWWTVTWTNIMERYIRTVDWEIECRFQHLWCLFLDCQVKLSGTVHNRMLSVWLICCVRTVPPRRRPGKTVPSHIPVFHAQCSTIFKQETT